MRENILFLILMFALLLYILHLKEKLDKLTENNINLRAHLDFIEKKLSESWRED